MAQQSERKWPTCTDPAGSTARAELLDLLPLSEGWLMGRILQYAKDRGYTRYTSTLLEAWRLSIKGLSRAFMETLEDHGTDPELGPEEDYTLDPAACFGTLEAGKHRERGVSLGMFLGLMTNEKNKYLTAFESLPDPVFIVDPESRIENMNLAAALRFEEGCNPGAKYYRIPGRDQGKATGSGLGRPIHLLLPWITEDLNGFAKGRADHQRIERVVETKHGGRVFQVHFSRMLDVSGKFEGSILILQDVTARKSAEEERLIKEKLQAILEMAGAVCHQLNQPLQGLTGHSELLLLDMEQSNPHYSRVSKMANLVHQMGTITRQLAGITRYETMRYLDGRIIDLQKASGSPESPS